VFDDIQFASGTVRQDEKERLSKMLFRLTRGKALTFFLDFTQGGTKKSVYIVVFQDYGGSFARVQKICDSFMGERFEIPPLHKIATEVAQVSAEIIRSRGLLEISILQLKTFLYDLNTDEDVNDKASRFVVYSWLIAKEKAIYTVLNMFKPRGSNYIGFLWAPVESESLIQSTITQYGGSEFKQLRRDPKDDHLIDPPTYFKTNDVTFVYQEITNTYGVPKYSEINPSVFGIVTFPF
jgi:V-type H+-transporting ATPase subunit a